MKKQKVPGNKEVHILWELRILCLALVSCSPSRAYNWEVLYDIYKDTKQTLA